MPLYIADYLAKTSHLSAQEHGAYLLLIMHYWKNGGLPANAQQLQRICRLDADAWEDAKVVLAEFFEIDNGWRHPRIEEELAKSGAISSKRRDAAKKRHASAEQVHSKCTANAQQMHTQSQSQSHTTLSNADAEREFRFAIADEFTRAGFLPPDTGRCVIWMQNGWVLSICIETTRALLAKKGKALPLTYIEPAIADAHAPLAKSSGVPRAGPARGPDKPPSIATQLLQSMRAKSQSHVQPDNVQDQRIIDVTPLARATG